jgi:dedicator of cytokinesis protein 3
VSQANGPSYVSLSNPLRPNDVLTLIFRFDCIDIEYVQSLVQSHASNGDYIEAGLALQLHSRLYEWKQDVFVEPFCQGEIDLASQSEFGRKESLLLQILDYWTRGKAFELAIRVCEELEAQHATKTFD